MKSNNYYNVERVSSDIFLTPFEGYDSTLIFMHGLGDSAEGYLTLFILPSRPVPNRFRIVLLTAPQAAVTMNGGFVMNSWYDIKYSDRNENSIEQNDVVKNSLRIKKVIESEAKNVNGDFSKLFIGGFSQGACMSLHLGLTYQENLGGIIALSGLLLPFTTKEIDVENKKDIAIYIGHGIYDTIIPEKLALASYKFLFDSGFTKVKYESFEADHTIVYEEFQAMKSFFKELANN